MQKRITIAYGSIPKGSGTYTFYRNLRPTLLQYGIDLRCVSVGRQQCSLWDDAFADQGCAKVAPQTSAIKAQSRAFTAWCEAQDVDIVIGINSIPILSALEHLPSSIRVVARCAAGFEHGYRITLSGLPRLSAIIAITPRLQNDLVDEYGTDPALIHLIPNGIEPSRFEVAAQQRTRTNSQELLNIGFLGRIEDSQKGVFHIPAIVKELTKLEIPFRMKIAGEGIHRKTIESQMKDDIRGGIVEFVGPLSPAQVPEFLSSNDLLLFLSRFEGCPNVLLEAMMSGCVPISWTIPGITDFIISDKETGRLCEMGNHRAMAAIIAELYQDRDQLHRLATNTAASARARFTSDIAARAYADMFHDIMWRPAPPCTPRPWSEFRVDPNFQASLSSRVKSRLQRLLRTLQHQFFQRPINE